MGKKITYIFIFVILSICVVVVLCRWKYNVSGFSTEKSCKNDTLCETSVDSAIVLPSVHQMVTPSEYLTVDTTLVFSASDIAYSEFVALYLDTVSNYAGIKHIIFSEYCIKINEDSLEYFYRQQMKSRTRETRGHVSPISSALYIEKSAYKIKNNIIYVQDYRIQILSDEKLKVLNLPKIPSGTILFCSMRFFHASKKLKYWGIWVNGKKDGDWFYIDEKRNVIREFYEQGNLVERNVNPNESWRQRNFSDYSKFSFIRW